jgi:hypothetical protein
MIRVREIVPVSRTGARLMRERDEEKGNAARIFRRNRVHPEFDDVFAFPL